MSCPVLGVLDATLSSGKGSNGNQGFIILPDSQAGTLFENNSFGLATCLLSLTTNLVATLLIAFKAWYGLWPRGLSSVQPITVVSRTSRMRLKGYLVAKAGGPSRAEKLFSILIESGTVYCAIWVSVLHSHMG